MLKITNLNKSYYEKAAVVGVDMELHKGEICGLIGPNGCGKTTLLKCLAGIYRADKGEILYDDEPIYDNPVAKVKIAYVSDNQEFIGSYSVKGLLKVYQNFFPDFSTERFYKLNTLFEINVKKQISNLSRGEKMRLGFMLALSQGAEYLLLDEPTGGMDLKAKKQFRDLLIKEMDERGLAVLIVSHDLRELESLCDKAILMEGSRIQIQKPLDELMDGVQKWQATAEVELTKEQKKQLGIVEESRVGNLINFYTVGDRAEHKKALEAVGLKELESQKITLEEVVGTLQECQL